MTGPRVWKQLQGPRAWSANSSGIATEAKPGWTAETLTRYARHVIDCFGPERVMWGSDWPVLELNGSYPQWHAAATQIVGTPGADAIFGGTAAKFYRI